MPLMKSSGGLNWPTSWSSKYSAARQMIELKAPLQ